jgi:anti-sigma-K factor RskA
MSDSTDRRPPEDNGRFAPAEYVLGVLSANERRELEQRLPRDGPLAREVADWEERLGVLVAEVRPVAPPDDMLSRIEGALDAPATTAAARALKREELWQSVVFWRTFSLGSATFAALSIAALTYIAILPTPRSPMMATLGNASGLPNFVAAIGAGGNELVIVPASLLTQDPRAMELWLIPAGDRPHSLGLIRPGQPVRLTVPPELAARLTTEAALAVSLEPAGGSPTGAPTGPVIASGKLTSL